MTATNSRTVTIHAPEQEIALYVEYVAEQVKEGYTSGHVGHGHYWESDLDS